jgi:Beta-propeller repeat
MHPADLERDARNPIATATGAMLVAAFLTASVFLLWGTLLSADKPGGARESAVAEDYVSLPLSFQPGTGSTVNGFDYLTRTQQGSIYLSYHGAALALNGVSQPLRLQMLGARPVDPVARERLPGVVNDLRGDDPRAWKTNIPTFERIRYPGLYPGISLDWYGNQRQLEYDFRVAAGANPAQIGMRVAGADAVRVTEKGDLVIKAGGETVRQRAPIAYQSTEGGQRERIEVNFAVEQNTVRFDLGAYDKDRPLVIDPLILGYSTYLGGAGSDAGEAIAVASTGSAYITGWTASEDFDTLNAVDPTGGDPRDAFVSKLSADGSFLVWSTYLGGSRTEFGKSIAVDADGAAYVTGSTDSVDFSTANPIQATLSGGQDAFVTKLPRTGDSLVYSTYLGGSYPESEAGETGRGIAVDSTGAAYVVGGTLSSDFPTVGAIEGDSAEQDAFITKLTPSGGALAYSTYLGGSGGDSAADVAVNASGAAFVTGGTSSTDFDTVNPFEGDSGGGDVFVSRLTPSGDALAYSTYLGGSGGESGVAIALDNVSLAYITGGTSSTDYDTASPQSGDLPGDDAFLSRLDTFANSLGYSTYLGGSGNDIGLGIAVSGSSVYVAGDTRSSDFPLLGAVDTYSGNGDAFVTKRNRLSGAVEYSTVLGGSSTEYANDIAADSSGAAYIVGRTFSSNFPTAQPIEGPTSPISEVFISRLASDTDEVLARRFQPILRFDEGERWRPLDVERMLSEETHYICEKSCKALTSFSQLAEYPSSKAYIDIGAPGDPGAAPRYSDPDHYYSPVCPPNGQVVDCESGPRSAIYYDTAKVSPSGYRYIQYWIFYRFNDSPVDEPGSLDHEADWEQMAVAVPSASALTASTFDFANFGQHGNNFTYLRENLTCDADTACGSTAKHVHGFVAGGTHATYAEPCSGILELICTQSNSALPETDHGGEASWANNGDASALRRLPAPYEGTWKKGPHAWVDWPGWWGLDAQMTADRVASPANQMFYDFPWEADCVDGSGCESQFNAAAAAQPQTADTAEGSRCGQWFGSGIAAISCDSTVLGETLAAAEVGDRSGAVDLVLLRSRGAAIEAATTRGLAQLAAKPLRPGDRLLIRGRAEHRGTLLVRSLADDAITIVRFSEQQLAGGQAVVVVKRQGSLAIPMLRQADGDAVAPYSVVIQR